MNETIKILLSLSLSGSILVVLIFFMKPFVKHKLLKSIQYYIWIVVLLRFIIPFSFEGSIMNCVFFNDKTPIKMISQGTAESITGVNKNISNSSILNKVQDNVTNGVYNGDTDHSRYLRDIFSQYAMYLWLLGVIITLTINLTEYVRFLKHLKYSNKPAGDEQNRILAAVINRRCNVRLVRNPFMNTPMLIGILKPYIVIPDVNFDEKQLKNIFLHELSHLKRFDIAVKWITLIATSIHWFNPLMYFIKREINHICELACDEEVIKNLTPEEKQDYGDTLISIATDHKYPIGVLQSTMCEEKKSLKERLIAIMNHNKKSRVKVVMSMLLLVVAIIGAIGLGASVKTISADIVTYDLAQISKYKTPYLGNNSKVSAIVSQIPVPDSYFKQQYISLLTSSKPYKLNVYYEANIGASHSSQWPISNPNNNATYSNLQKNALVMFCMIDNLDEVTFGFRDSQSGGKLDESKYNKSFTFSRASIEEKYGNIALLAKDNSLLEDVLTGKKAITNDVVSITTNINKYTPLMSSVQGISMTPDFKSDKKYTKLEYHWITERGSFSNQAEVTNQGETVLWGVIEKDQVIDIKDPFNIQLEVIDSENKVVLAKTKLKINVNGVSYEVSK